LKLAVPLLRIIEAALVPSKQTRKEIPVKTPINDINPHPVYQAEADALFKRMPYQYPEMLSESIRTIEAHWGVAKAHLDNPEVHHTYELRMALEATRQWIRNACTFIFYAEFMERVPATIAEEHAMPNPRDRALALQVRRLLNLTRRIIHELQRDRRHDDATELTALYAEAITAPVRNTLGTHDSEDKRYKHSERATWVRLHARTKRRLANLFDRWAQHDEELALRMDATKAPATV
jgi:hypothetical protein